MGKKIIKVSLYIIGGILTIVLVLLVGLWTISPGKADPITGPDGNLVEGSISVIEKITLGGQDQYLTFSGLFWDRTGGRSVQGRANLI